MSKTKKYMSTKIACYTGYFVQAIINNLAPLFYVIFQNEFEINYTKISWLIMLNFITQLFVDIMSVKVIEKLGYRVSIVFAHVFSSLGLFLLGVLPRAMENHYIGLVIPIIIYATGSGLIEVLVSPIVEGLPLENKSGEMSLLHSFYCWGQMSVVLFTTIAIKFAGSENWVYAPMLWAIIPFINMFMFMKVPIFPPVPEGEDEMKVSELFRSGTFILLALLMLCAGASELAMSQWASTFAEESLGVDKLTGDLLGPCLFALLMASARVVFGLVGDKVDVKKVLTFSAGLCVTAYLLSTLSKSPIVSLIGCGLCGLSVATMWPGVFSFAAKIFPRGGTPLFAMLAVFGDFGCAFGPWLAGVVSDGVRASTITFDPLKFGLMIAVVFPITMIITISVLSKKKNIDV
ncbi:MAG: MFS transporter [Acutalibacteraceae bacterium]|nr:MFS transporter [Acutalibacteraceae bacterium]